MSKTKFCPVHSNGPGAPSHNILYAPSGTHVDAVQCTCNDNDDTKGETTITPSLKDAQETGSVSGITILDRTNDF